MRKRSKKRGNKQKKMGFSRRQFLKACGIAGAALCLPLNWSLGPCRAYAAISGGSLDPASVSKYQTPMLIPPVMPKAGTIMQRGRPIDYYEISMRQFAEQI